MTRFEGHTEGVCCRTGNGEYRGMVEVPALREVAYCAPCCSIHKAAPDLLRACEAMRAVLTDAVEDVDGMLRSWTPAARCALALADDVLGK